MMQWTTTRWTLRASGLAATLALATSVAAAGASSSPAPVAPRKYVVLPFVAARGVDPSTAKLLDELMLTELSRRAATGDTFLGANDIAAVLGLEQQKHMLNCGDEGCMAEVGNALGADLIVAGSVGQLGTQHVLTVKLLDPKAIKVLKRESVTVAGDEGALPGGVSQLADRLLGPAPAGAVSAVSATPPTISPSASASAAKDDGFGVLGWVGVGTAAIGAIALAGASAGVIWADSTLADAGSSGASKETAETAYWAALAGLGLGGVLAVAGAIVAVVGG